MEAEIKNGNHDQTKAEELTKHMIKVRKFMTQAQPYIEKLQPGDWYVVTYVGMTEKQTFDKR